MPTPTTSRLANRNVMSIAGRTSMRLEPEVWAALEEICHREDVTLAELVTPGTTESTVSLSHVKRARAPVNT